MLFITTLCLLLEIFVYPFVHITLFPLNQPPEIQSRYFLTKDFQNLLWALKKSYIYENALESGSKTVKKASK